MPWKKNNPPSLKLGRITLITFLGMGSKKPNEPEELGNLMVNNELERW